MTRKILSPAKRGTIPMNIVRKAVKSVLNRHSKAEKVAAGKDITQ